MRDKLSIEWMKIRNYKTFWILSSLYIISLFAINFIVFRIQQTIYHNEESRNMTRLILGNTPYSFPTTWQMTAYVASFLLFIPGLLIIISVTNEYTYRTHRQNIIDGWSRKTFISVKLLLALILAIISTLMVILSALILGFADGSTDFSMKNIEFIGYFFLQSLSYILAAMLIAILIKRGGFAIGIFFLYSLILENFLKFIINFRGGVIGRYLPLQSTDELIPLPILKNVQARIITPPDYPTLLTAVFVYLAAYLFIIYRRFQTADL